VTGIYIVGTIFPPLLPTVFVVSVGISSNRLQSKRISCTFPESLLVAGKVDAAFFDKTGTLTQQGISFISIEGCGTVVDSHEDHVRLGMAVCHTLTVTSGGDLVGTQVDKASFLSSGAILEPSSSAETACVVSFQDDKYAVVRQFEFDNHQQTQSVVIKTQNDEIFVFAKGSPEAIKNLCTGSSLPDTYDETVRESAKAAVYQLALAHKRLDPNVAIADLSRAEVESGLTFGAFISFSNVIRAESASVVQELHEGDVTTTMITGDNVVTGVVIAREAGIIPPNTLVLLGRKSTSDIEVEWLDFDSNMLVSDPIQFLSSSDHNAELAITGEAWTLILEHDPKFASLIARRIRVFGRCTPSDKVSVIANFVEMGNITLMCGDGQNDCGSLKAAHVGVALSSAEASVVAPFTSLDKTVTSVPEVLREGRCALASALSVYSYYIVYGQTESFLQTINAYFSITFSEFCWIFLDGIWPITLAFSLPQARAAKRLTPRRPTSSLLGQETVFSVCGILGWNFVYLTIALVALFNQDWFACRRWHSDDVSNVRTIGDNYETTVLFVVGGFQYIASAMALNFGYTFRQSWWKNYVFVGFSLLWCLFFLLMTLYPSNFSCIWRVNCSNDVSATKVKNAGGRICLVLELLTLVFLNLLESLATLTGRGPLGINPVPSSHQQPLEHDGHADAVSLDSCGHHGGESSNHLRLVRARLAAARCACCYKRVLPLRIS
jgi:predicted P-type ATPase